MEPTIWARQQHTIKKNNEKEIMKKLHKNKRENVIRKQTKTSFERPFGSWNLRNISRSLQSENKKKKIAWVLRDLFQLFLIKWKCDFS